MATTTHSTETATDLAAEVESASFVRVIARADGDALAASGILARVLADRETPFHVSVAGTIGDRTERTRETETDELTLVIGASDSPDTDDIRSLEPDDRPASLLACDLVAELDGTTAVDPVLALAGAFAAGVEPGAGETEWLLESATDRGVLTQRPGVAVPTDDLVDGLAHTTLCRAPWSGDLEATRGALESVMDRGEDSHRDVASCVALDVVGDDGATTASAHAVTRLLGPYAIERDGRETGADEGEDQRQHPFTTIGGYADVLEATARRAPGIGVALTMDPERIADGALEAWREHGRHTHEALSSASTGRYDGLFVLRIDDGPVETVARLAAAFRSPEPLVLTIGDGEAALATRDDRSLEGPLEAVARECSLGGAYDVGRRRGYVRFGGHEVEDATIIEAVREIL